MKSVRVQVTGTELSQSERDGSEAQTTEAHVWINSKSWTPIPERLISPESTAYHQSEPAAEAEPDGDAEVLPDSATRRLPRCIHQLLLKYTADQITQYRIKVSIYSNGEVAHISLSKTKRLFEFKSNTSNTPFT